MPQPKINAQAENTLLEVPRVVYHVLLAMIARLQITTNNQVCVPSAHGALQVWECVPIVMMGITVLQDPPTVTNISVRRVAIV
jgi:hypothetical protein